MSSDRSTNIVLRRSVECALTAAIGMMDEARSRAPQLDCDDERGYGEFLRAPGEPAATPSRVALNRNQNFGDSALERTGFEIQFRPDREDETVPHGIDSICTRSYRTISTRVCRRVCRLGRASGCRGRADARILCGISYRPTRVSVGKRRSNPSNLIFR